MANLVKTDAVLETGDLQIGAVEIKNASTDDRASVVNAAPTTEYGLVTRNIPSGTQPVTLPTAATLTTAQVSVDTTSGGVLVAALNTSRKFLEITNTSSSVNVYIGNTGLTTSTGHVLPPGSSFTLDSTICTGAIYGIVVTGSVTVTTMAW